MRLIYEDVIHKDSIMSPSYVGDSFLPMLFSRFGYAVSVFEQADRDSAEELQ